MRKYSWVAVSLFFFGAIAENRNPVADINSVDLTVNNGDNLQTDNRFDIAAEKIAGTYFGKNKTPESEKYSKFIKNAWDKLLKDSLGHVPNWTKKNLSKHIRQFDTLFYPFGGPDVSYAISFFPNAKRYILVGLEPLGNFDQIENSLKSNEYYDSLQTAFSTYLEKGYFVTSEMQKHLSNKATRGGLNLVLLALKKLGFSIQKVENCFIDADGKIIQSDQNGIECVKIACQKNSQEKEIYYIKTNLDNENNQLNNLLKFVQQFDFSTFVKSSSYAMHNRGFSQIRRFILDKTNCILQDDTGVPFNFFRKNWDIHIFGTYTEPTLAVFRVYKQNSLKEYYLKNKAGAIPFPIGYRYTRRTPKEDASLTKRPAKPNLTFVISQKKLIKRQLEELKNQLVEKKCNCYK